MTAATYVTNDANKEQGTAEQLSVVARLLGFVVLVPVALRHRQIIVAGRAMVQVATAVRAAQHADCVFGKRSGVQTRLVRAYRLPQYVANRTERESVRVCVCTCIDVSHWVCVMGLWLRGYVMVANVFGKQQETVS